MVNKCHHTMKKAKFFYKMSWVINISCSRFVFAFITSHFSDESFHYVPLTEELLQGYPQLRVAEEPMDTVDLDGKQKAHWTYDATILLINKYKHYQPFFADSIHKNVEVGKYTKSSLDNILLKSSFLCLCRFGTWLFILWCLMWRSLEVHTW